MVVITKYNIGDHVWVMRNNKPEEFIIENIMIIIGAADMQKVPIQYKLNKHMSFIKEPELYTTKEELIKTLYN